MEYSSEYQNQMYNYWESVRIEMASMKCDHAVFKTQDLPLARIKKIMKLDDDIKSMMISAEAPILFAKAAELFIRELTMRAWLHTERNRRRTLQRNDIGMAISDGDTDQFDFLIDIVPREEIRGHRRAAQSLPSSVVGTTLGIIKNENSASPATYVAATNGRATHQVVDNDSSISLGQPQTVTIALGGAGTSATPTRNNLATTIVQHAQAPTIQFATTIPSSSGILSAQSSAITSLTNAISNASGNTAPIQYVLQLPMGAAGNASGQPFQIQLLPQQFQMPEVTTGVSLSL